MFGCSELLLPGVRPDSKKKCCGSKSVYILYAMKKYWYGQLYFHNRAATVVLGCVADRITNITQKCMD